MKKSEKSNRLRALKIWDILQRETDDEHPMGTETLKARLSEYGIEAHRTTIYQDIKLLNHFGYEVLVHRGRSNQYYVMDRTFSDPELHILLDAVQAASFITEKKTADLVDRIANLAGSQRGAVLKKNIVHFNTTKSTNESIYYSVDRIATAINERKKIIFLYFDYNNQHERVYRRNGHHYVVSPLATVFSDGRYYLVIYDKRYGKITHYRIDRMERVEVIEETADMPPEELCFDIAAHKKQLFGMFSGESTEVTLEIHKSLIDVAFDLFGADTKVLPNDDDTVRIAVKVQISPLFFGWCCSFGQKVRLIGPTPVVRELNEYIEALKFSYQ